MADKAVSKGVDTGIMSATREAVSKSREDLAISLATLKATSEAHILARERSQHAVAVAMAADTALSNFMQHDYGSLPETVRVSANASRNKHDLCMAEFDNLDAEIAAPYHAAPALPVASGKLDFVHDRYEPSSGSRPTSRWTSSNLPARRTPA